MLATGTGRERLDTLRGELATLFARERSVAAQRERRADRRSDIAVVVGLVGMGLVALVALGMWLGLRRSILRPVERVALATRAVADGDLTVHVPADREDEIGTLARSFNDMTDALNRSHTELDARTRELERSNHDLEQYAQMASHDLQAPLATIDLYLRLIERRLPDASQEELLQLLEGVGGSTERMRSLVRDLLHLARVGRGEPRRETLDTRRGARPGARGPRRPDQRRAAPTSAPGRCRSSAATRASSACCSRTSWATRSSSATATRRASASRRRSRAREAQFAVRDNGIGIDPQHAERIFQPFQRLHGEDRYEGTGIGLAICQRIVSHHGGRIWAESTVGRGQHVPLHAAAGRRRPAAAPRRRRRDETETSHAAAA